MQGIKFKLTYHVRPSFADKISFKRDKTEKVEYYESRNLAQIMDGLHQVTKLYEENERQLDLFVAYNNPVMEEVSLEQNQAAAQNSVHNRNCIVNVNGSFVATRDTYRSRAQAAAVANQKP